MPIVAVGVGPRSGCGCEGPGIQGTGARACPKRKLTSSVVTEGFWMAVIAKWLSTVRVYFSCFCRNVEKSLLKNHWIVKKGDMCNTSRRMGLKLLPFFI